MGTGTEPKSGAGGLGWATDPHDPQARLGQAFRAVTVAMRRLRGRQSRHRDGALSYAQMGLLFGLETGDNVSARELAEVVALSPATVTQMLEALESEGLVERTRSANDRRVVLTHLTEHGRELMYAHKAEMQGRWRATLARFDDAQLDTAAEVLSALAAMFENYESD
jgi:DNA-binding MarR family transcriptional regulator